MDRKWFKTLKRELGLLFSSFHLSFAPNNAQHHLIYSAATATRFFLHSKQIWKSINSRKAKAAAKNIIYNIQPTHTWHKHNNYFSFLHFRFIRSSFFFFLLASLCCFWVWVSRCVLLCFFFVRPRLHGFPRESKRHWNEWINNFSVWKWEWAQRMKLALDTTSKLCIMHFSIKMESLLCTRRRAAMNEKLRCCFFLRWWEQKKFSRKKRETSYNNAIFISTCCINQFSI